MAFVKVRFYAGSETTAGLVLDAAIAERMSMGDFSRLFPTFETPKMKRLQVSPAYATYEQAFNHDFGG